MALDEQDLGLDPGLHEIKKEELDLPPDIIKYEGSGSEEDEPTDEQGNAVLSSEPGDSRIKTEPDCEDSPLFTLKAESAGSNLEPGEHTIKTRRTKERKLREAVRTVKNTEPVRQLVKHNRYEKLYSCDRCHYKCNKKSHLKSHQTLHKVEKQFICDICNCKYKWKSCLKRHIQTHKGDKPFSCNICDTTFTHKSSLVVHKRTHTGEKPFSCDICSYKFSRRSYLTQHNTRIHTSLKLFSCDVCAYKAKIKRDLTRHIMRTHSGHKFFACYVLQ